MTQIPLHVRAAATQRSPSQPICCCCTVESSSLPLFRCSNCLFGFIVICVLRQSGVLVLRRGCGLSVAKLLLWSPSPSHQSLQTGRGEPRAPTEPNSLTFCAYLCCWCLPVLLVSGTSASERTSLDQSSQKQPLQSWSFRTGLRKGLDPLRHVDLW